MGRIAQSRLSLSAELRKQRSTLTNKGTLFEGTGIHFPSPGVVQVDGAMQVTGSLDVDSTINVDGDATFNGDTTIGGNAAITGTLSLPEGIIDNDALSNPVVPKVGHGDGSGFGVTNGSGDVVATATITVPTGFTQALVTAIASVTAFNTTAVNDALYAGAIIGGGGSGWLTPTDVEPSRIATVTNGATALLTGLGASFTVQALAATNAANWSASGANVANIDATVLFLR